MRVELNVPYEEKDYAKRKGARWDPIRKTWYAKDLNNLWPLLKYMSERHRAPCRKPHNNKVGEPS